MKPIIFTLFSNKKMPPFQNSSILENSILESEPQPVKAGIDKFGVWSLLIKEHFSGNPQPAPLGWSCSLSGTAALTQPANPGLQLIPSIFPLSLRETHFESCHFRFLSWWLFHCQESSLWSLMALTYVEISMDLVHMGVRLLGLLLKHF